MYLKIWIHSICSNNRTFLELFTLLSLLIKCLHSFYISVNCISHSGILYLSTLIGSVCAKSVFNCSIINTDWSVLLTCWSHMYVYIHMGLAREWLITISIESYCVISLVTLNDVIWSSKYDLNLLIPKETFENKSDFFVISTVPDIDLGPVLLMLKSFSRKLGCDWLMFQHQPITTKLSAKSF